MALTIGEILGKLTFHDGITPVLNRVGAKLTETGNKWQKTGARMTSAGASMTSAITLPIAAVGGASVVAFGNFDDAMTKSLAIMGDVSDEMKDKMATAAREAALAQDGAASSAKDAADSYFFLASAGLDAEASIAALPVVTKFAKAGNFDMALATDLLTDAQSALGETIRDDAVANMKNMIKVSDVLVKANTLANATVQQFSESLTTKAGTAMKLLNIEMESGVAVLAAWADQGVKGTLAGERFGIVTRDLQKIHREHKDVLDKYGIAVFDASGEFRNMSDIILDLEDATAGMSTEQVSATLATLGFQNRSIAATKSLLGLSGQIKEYENKLRDAGGITDEVAKKQMQSLWAQLGLLKSRLVDVAIKLGDALVPAVKALMSGVDVLLPILSSAVDIFVALPSPIQAGAVTLVALAAAAGPVLVAFGSLLKVVGMVSVQMPVLTSRLVALRIVALGPLGIAIAAIAAAFAIVNKAIVDWSNTLSAAIDKTISKTRNFTDSIKSIEDVTSEVIRSNNLQSMNDLYDTQRSRMDELQKSIALNALELEDANKVYDAAIDAGASFEQAQDAVRVRVNAAELAINEARIEMNKLERSTDEIKSAMDDWKPTIVAVTNSVDDLGTKSGDTATALHTSLAEAGVVAKIEIEQLGDSTDKTASKLDEVPPVAEETAAAIEKVAKSFSHAEEAGNSFTRFMDTEWGRAVDSFLGHANQISSIVGDIFGEGAQREFEAWTGVAEEGFAAWSSFAQGDAIGTVVHGVNALKGAYDSLFPSTVLVEERIATYIDTLKSGEGTVEDFENLTYDLWKTLEKVTSAGWDASRAADIMSESFSDFVDVAVTMGDQGFDAIKKVVDEAKIAGVGLEDIADKLAEVWTDAMAIVEERNQFLLDQSRDLLDGLTVMLGDFGNVTAREIEFAAVSMWQAFNSMLAGGASVIDIVQQLGDVFGLIQGKGEEMGLNLGIEFTQLGDLMELLADEKIQRVIERLDGMTAAAEAAANMGLLTTEQFDIWENRVTATFNKLVEGGAASEVALAALKGPLQALLNASQQYGFSVDANTQELLDMALAQGVIADQGLTTENILMKGFDRMLKGINRLIVALGGVPVAFAEWGAAANDVDDTMDRVGRSGRDSADEIRRSWDRATEAIGRNSDAARQGRENNRPNEDDEDDDDRPGREGYQFGSKSFVNFGGQGTPVTLHGVEQVVTAREGDDIVSMVRNAINTSGNSAAVTANMNDPEIARLLNSLVLLQQRSTNSMESNTRAVENMTDRITDLEARRYN